MASPTSRTIAYLTRRGWRAGVVERYVSFCHRRYDLYGFIDIVAIHPETRRIVGVQATGSTHGNIQQHYRKIVDERSQEALDWLAVGGEIELWGWKKKYVVGKGEKTKAVRRRAVYVPIVVTITKADFRKVRTGVAKRLKDRTIGRKVWRA